MEMQPRDFEILGATKIKDGLFIGDELAAQDLEFVVTNKVTHVINCAGRQIQNHWEPIGVIYLTLNWSESDHQILFDAKDEVLNEIYRFIEATMVKGESVLVHSVKGQNRSCCVLAAYFMKKYRWTLYKTLEFLHARKPTLEIRSNFFTQLTNLENHLAKLGQGAKTFNWNELSDDPKNIESEELLLTNTFLNSKKPAPIDIVDSPSPKKENPNKVNFSEENHIQHHPKEKRFTNLFNRGELAKKEAKSTNIQTKTSIKSILKGSGKIFQLAPTVESENAGPGAVTLNGTMKKSEIMNSEAANGIRPNSSQGINSKSKATRDSALDPHEVAKGAAPNIQGNIIHITVNNYITNTSTLDNGSSGNVGGNKSTTDEPKPVRMGLSTSNSSKDLNFNSSSKEDNPFGKRGYSPTSSFDNRKIGNNSKGLSATLKNEMPKKLSYTDDDDEGPLVRNQKFKVNSTANKTSLAIYGHQNLPKGKNLSGGSRPMSSTQHTEKELAVIGSNNLSTKINQINFRTPTYYKYMNPGQGGPINFSGKIRPGQREQVYENGSYPPIHAYGQQNFVNQREKQNLRPNTAPEQKFANSLKNSPYLTNSLGHNPQNRKGRTLDSAQEPRQSSLPPSKENSATNSYTNGRLRSSSPGQPLKNSLVGFTPSEMTSANVWNS